MAKNPINARISEVESYMCEKGQEYRTIDKTRAGRIYERLKVHITPPKRTIQVLGTNGKGSTGRFLALMLIQNGAKVLHFTSPHIFSFNERFYKNGAQNGSIVGDDELLRAHRFLQRFDFIGECSYFEYATFLALVLAQGVDYLILEAGVGGELDSTSVIARDLCVFSVIDYDHTEILGESIEAIATTKLNAVFYPNRVKKMLLGAQKYEVVERIAKEIAKAHNVEIFTLDSANQNNPSLRANPQDLRGNPPIEKTQNPQNGLPRSHSLARNDEFIRDSSLRLRSAQNDNVGLDSADSQNLQGGCLLRNARKSFGLPRRFCESARNDEFIRDSSLRLRSAQNDNLGLDSSPTAQNDKIQSYFTKHNLAPFLAQNLALALKALEILGQSCDLKTLPPLDLRGRFEAIAPNIIIDVGHNQNAAFAIKQNLGQKKVILVYNSYFQKNIGEILATLKGNIKSVQILRLCDNPRIIKQEILEQILGNLNISYKNFDGAKSLDKDENYLVFGSFSVVEAFMRDYSGENQK